VSFHKGTLVPPGKYDWTCACFDPLESTTDMANGSVQLLLHVFRQKVPILYNGCPYPPELPLPMEDLDLSCNTRWFRLIWVHNPNGTSIGSSVFAQMTAQCNNSLPVFPSKLPLPMLASGPHLMCGSLVPPKSGMQMTTWSFQPFLQGWQTDRATERQTDHATQCGAA